MSQRFDAGKVASLRDRLSELVRTEGFELARIIAAQGIAKTLVDVIYGLHHRLAAG
jgi:hypothetical protein